MFDNPRERDAAANAVAMCVAGQRRDLETIYAIWNTTTIEDRPALIATLAQLPGAILQAGGLDPQSELETMVLTLASMEGTDDE